MYSFHGELILDYSPHAVGDKEELATAEQTHMNRKKEKVGESVDGVSARQRVSGTRPTKGRATISEVAMRAGVSKSLVSLVMRNSDKVSVRRREIVLAAATELGYRPNLNARRLVEQRTRTIGVVVSDLHNPFFAEIIDGVYDGADSHELSVLLAAGRRSPDEEARAVEHFLQQNVEGLVLLAPMLNVKLLLEVSKHVACVVVARGDLRVPHCDVLVNDDLAGAELAIGHLVDLGHRHITHISAGVEVGAETRRQGYERAMAARGLAHCIRVVQGDATDVGGAHATEVILDTAPETTAIFAYNDYTAIGALTVLQDRGVTVPHNVSLMGYDNTHIAAMRNVLLTSIDQPRAEMGHLAVVAVAKRLKHLDAAANRKLLAPKLVVRATTARPRSNSSNRSR
jgi:DNA-binding LacI/PurR family transcriptional regulator